MRDGGEPPIRRVLGPDHREEDRATCNLAGKRKGRKECAMRGQTRGEMRRENWEELWKNIQSE
jgi:hypothetical protein